MVYPGFSQHSIQAEKIKLDIQKTQLHSNLHKLEKDLVTFTANELTLNCSELDVITGSGHLSNIFREEPETEYQAESSQQYKKGYDLILNEKWTEAVDYFNNFIKTNPRSMYIDDASFWLCYAKEKTGQPLQDSFDCYKNFSERFKDSEWADDAQRHLIRIGHILVKQGNKEYEPIIKSYEKNTDEEISLAALYALQNIGDEKAVDTTIDIYDRTKSEKIKEK
ncbi:MAG: hypothetical protein P8078_12065, partial [bacterium]